MTCPVIPTPIWAVHGRVGNVPAGRGRVNRLKLANVTRIHAKGDGKGQPAVPQLLLFVQVAVAVDIAQIPFKRLPAGRNLSAFVGLAGHETRQNQGTDGGHGKPHTGQCGRAGKVAEQRQQSHANQRSQRQNPYANAAVLVAHGFRAASKEAQLGRLTVEVLFQSGQLAVKLVPQTR